jgi:hypothetical protein
VKSNTTASRGVARTEGNPEDAPTNETFAFMATGNKLIDSGTAAFSRRLGQYRRRRRQQVFDAKVVQALAELGLSPANFDVRVKDLLTRVCTACSEKDGARANAHALALEFFLRLALEYPHLMDKAVKFQGVLVEAVSVIRSWHLVNRIDTALADSSIERIKNALVAELRKLDDTDEDRLAAELHIREL